MSLEGRITKLLANRIETKYLISKLSEDEAEAAVLDQFAQWLVTKFVQENP